MIQRHAKRLHSPQQARIGANCSYAADLGLTNFVPHSLYPGSKVQGFLDCQHGLMQVILVHIRRSVHSPELVKALAIVSDVSLNLQQQSKQDKPGQRGTLCAPYMNQHYLSSSGWICRMWYVYAQR